MVPQFFDEALLEFRVVVEAQALQHLGHRLPGGLGQGVPGPVIILQAILHNGLGHRLAAQTTHVPGFSLDERLEAYEGQIVREAYSQLHTTVAVAKHLGISQATSARKIAKYVKQSR